MRNLFDFFTKKTEGLPDDGRHSGDNTMLSTAIPPYEKSLIAAIIIICNDRKFNRWWKNY